MEMSIFLWKWTMWKKIFFDTIKEEKSVYEEEKNMKKEKRRWMLRVLISSFAYIYIFQDIF